MNPFLGSLTKVCGWSHPITARSFERDYFIDGYAFERAYKNTISGVKDWTEAEHAEDWLIFSESMHSIVEACEREKFRLVYIELADVATP